VSEPIKTSDTSLAAYLHYNGHTLVGLMKDPNDNHRKVYVFVKKDDSEDLTEEYQSGEVSLHPKLYYKSIRIMHRTLKDGKLIDETTYERYEQ
jgi:hypothetical protein